jgi:RNA polymerase-interacting CarD/CdnL/TRCF family regulator
MERKMGFHVGDLVIHWTLGPGEVIGLEEKSLSGENTLYYLVKAGTMTIFVPVDGNINCRLRFPSKPNAYKKLAEILSAPGLELSENRVERKAYLRKNLSDGSAESLCGVIRDLNFQSRKKHLTDEDKNTLERALNLFQSEMVLSLCITPDQAKNKLDQILLEQAPLVV